MPYVKVNLVDLYCADTEDVTGADTVYLVGGVTDGSTTKAVLTRPMWINDGQTKVFKDSTVYEGHLAPGSQLGVTLTAYDEDSSKDWSRYSNYVTKLEVEMQSKVPVVGDVAAMLLEIAAVPLRLGTFLAKADKDDRLGTDTRTITLTPGSQLIQASFAGHAVSWWSDWRYRLRYAVNVNPGVRLANQRSGKWLDVSGASKEAGAQLIQWPPTGGDNQRFMLAGTGEPGTDRLLAIHSGLCLEAEGGGAAVGTRVVQGSWTGGSHQMWQIALGSAPLVRIVSKGSGKVLAVTGVKERAPVVLVDPADNPNQWWSSLELWRLIRARQLQHR